MPRNSEGLRRSARLKKEATMRRAIAALQRMEEQNRNVNFRSLAAEARVSAAWLYSQQELRGKIMRLRMGSPPATPASRDQREVSRRNIVETLRARIKSLEEKNRELKALLELAYGELVSTTEPDGNYG